MNLSPPSPLPSLPERENVRVQARFLEHIAVPKFSAQELLDDFPEAEDTLANPAATATKHVDGRGTGDNNQNITRSSSDQTPRRGHVDARGIPYSISYTETVARRRRGKRQAKRIRFLALAKRALPWWSLLLGQRIAQRLFDALKLKRL